MLNLHFRLTELLLARAMVHTALQVYVRISVTAHPHASKRTEIGDTRICLLSCITSIIIYHKTWVKIYSPQNNNWDQKLTKFNSILGVNKKNKKKIRKNWM